MTTVTEERRSIRPVGLRTRISMAFAISGLTAFAWPPNAAVVPQYAFFSCDSLAEVTGLGLVTSVETYAFSQCDLLPHVFLPDGCTVGDYAFTDTA